MNDIRQRAKRLISPNLDPKPTENLTDTLSPEDKFEINNLPGAAEICKVNINTVRCQVPKECNFKMQVEEDRLNLLHTFNKVQDESESSHIMTSEIGIY